MSPLPFGIVASPGSTVLFTGKLMLLLLVYIREDAVVVRQPIYGLLIGNVLLFALAFADAACTAPARFGGRAADFGFLDEMGALMVWGTLDPVRRLHHDDSAVRAAARRRSGGHVWRGWRSPARWC